MKRTVLASFEDAHGAQCIDVFRRDDGSFGFEQYRSEADGDRRWQCLDRYAQMTFASGDAALRGAQQRVSWLNPAEVWRW